jgi:hypothetical protein
MKSLTMIVGILLILAGIVAVAYEGITYTQQEKVAEIGSLKVTNDSEKTLPLSPMMGGLSLVAGIVLVVVARKGNK